MTERKTHIASIWASRRNFLKASATIAGAAGVHGTSGVSNFFAGPLQTPVQIKYCFCNNYWKCNSGFCFNPDPISLKIFLQGGGAYDNNTIFDTLCQATHTGRHGSLNLKLHYRSGNECGYY